MNYVKPCFPIVIFIPLLIATAAYADTTIEYWTKIERYNGSQKQCMDVAYKTLLKMGFREIMTGNPNQYITFGKKGVYGGGMQCVVGKVGFSTFGHGNGKSGAVLLNSVRTKFLQEFRR
jgi:hypothetical protein